MSASGAPMDPGDVPTAPEPPTGYTAQRLGEITGLSANRLAELEQLGMLARQDDGRYPMDSVERVTLARHAVARGVADNQIATFCRDHPDILESLLTARATSATAYTVEEALAMVPLDDVSDTFVSAMMELVGPQAGEPLTEEDFAALQMVFAALRTSFPAEALLQLVRVYAESMERIAETENRVFHDYVHEQNRAEGLAGRELFEATQAVSEPLLAMAEPALIYMHQRALQRAMRDDFVRHLTEDTRPPQQRPGEAPATVVFVDLAGFTPLTLTMGDDAAAEVLARFASIIWGAAGRARGRIIKQIGDAFMLVFDQPRDAVSFGADVCTTVAGESQFPPVHVGAHYGSVLHRDGDYVGNTVNLAARVAGATRPGQFLATQDVIDIAAGSARSEPLPPITLKGIDSPVQLYDVHPAVGEQPASRDPVCGMTVRDDDNAALSAEVDGNRYRFCTDECRDKFLAAPATYLDGS